MDKSYDEEAVELLTPYSDETPEELEPKEGMTDEDLQGAVAAEIKDAVDFNDEYLQTMRVKASQYFHGAPFGDEEEGRSQVVSRDVADSINAYLPNLMRIFFSAEKVVEYIPENPEDVAGAEQATDYINHIIQKENNGFTVLYSAFKDALIRKTGIIKWWWDESTCVKTARYTGLDDMAFQSLMTDPEVEIRNVESIEQMTMIQDPMTGQMVEQIMTYYNVEAAHTKTMGRARIAAVPPEEFLLDRKATCLDDATFVGHRSMKTVSELVAMGYEKEDVEEYVENDIFWDNAEVIERNQWQSFPDSGTNDVSTRHVLYVEGFMKVDYDGDGIAELRRICTMGPGYEIVMNEPWDDVQFADFCPDPEPHTVIGNSIADRVMDIQDVKSHVMRGVLDSLALSIHPRMGVVEGQVNMEDVMNTEMGAIIRQRAPGMVQPYDVPFVGQQAFPVLQYMDEIRENRTGMSKAAMGLNADALQSSTKAAVAATITAGQQQIELVARIFAETGVKRLFKGLLKLVCKNQDKAKIVRLRNQFVPIDPRAWNADMDVTVNIALGAASDEEKLMALTQVAAKQEQIMQLLGPQNVLTDVKKYHYTLTKMTELVGFKDSSQFWNDPATTPAPPPAPPKPTPEEVIAQVEREKAQLTAQTTMAKAQADQVISQQKVEIEKSKQEVDTAVKVQEMAIEREKMQLERERMEFEKYKLAMQLQIEEMKLQGMAQKQMIEAQKAQEKEDGMQRARQEEEMKHEQGEGHMAQAVTMLGQMMTAPRRVVRDPQGRVAGVEIGGVE
jgi:hypothetical protein